MLKNPENEGKISIAHSLRESWGETGLNKEITRRAKERQRSQSFHLKRKGRWNCCVGPVWFGFLLAEYDVLKISTNLIRAETVLMNASYRGKENMKWDVLEKALLEVECWSSREVCKMERTRDVGMHLRFSNLDSNDQLCQWPGIKY